MNRTVAQSNSGTENDSRGSVALLVISGLVLSALLAFRCQVTTQRFLDQDELVQLNAAYFITRGETLYSSFFENHPPLTVLLLQPIVRSTDVAETMIKRARLLMLGLTAAILVVVACLARFAGGWSSAVFAATLLLSHTFFFQKTLEVRPDVPALLFLLLALGVLIRGASSNRWHWPFLGGVLLCTAGLFTPKVIYVSVGATLAASFFGAGGTRPVFRSLRKLALIVLGAALVAAIAAIEMQRQGILQGFLSDAVETSLRMRIDDPAAFRWHYLGQMVSINTGACLLAILGMVVLARKRAPLPAGLAPVLCVSLATGLLGLFLNQAPLRQLFLPFLPQVAVLGSVGMLALVRTLRNRFPRPVSWFTLLAVLLAVVLPPTISLRKNLPSMQAQLMVLNTVLNVTDHHDRVFDCWTGLYLTRLPAYRYFFLNTDVQRMLKPEKLRREVLQSLRKPEVKLVITDPDFAGLPDEIHRFAAVEFAPIPNVPFLRVRK